MEKAYHAIDADGDGKLSTKDISTFMDQPMNEHKLMKILDDPEAFDEFDGFFSYKDFENIMSRVLQAAEKYLRSRPDITNIRV